MIVFDVNRRFTLRYFIFPCEKLFFWLNKDEAKWYRRTRDTTYMLKFLHELRGQTFCTDTWRSVINFVIKYALIEENN